MERDASIISSLFWYVEREHIYTRPTQDFCLALLDTHPGTLLYCCLMCDSRCEEEKARAACTKRFWRWRALLKMAYHVWGAADAC